MIGSCWVRSSMARTFANSTTWRSVNERSVSVRAMGGDRAPSLASCTSASCAQTCPKLVEAQPDRPPRSRAGCSRRRVTLGRSDCSWNTMPMPAAAAPAAALLSITSRPRSMIRPAVGSRRPGRALEGSVDLPAPFSPTRPTTSCGPDLDGDVVERLQPGKRLAQCFDAKDGFASLHHARRARRCQVAIRMATE